MNESMLNSLMQLFAIMANINKEAVHVLARNFVDSYLTRQFSQRLAEKYLMTFDEYSAALRAALGLEPDELFILQPTDSRFC